MHADEGYLVQSLVLKVSGLGFRVQELGLRGFRGFRGLKGSGISVLFCRSTADAKRREWNEQDWRIHKASKGLRYEAWSWSR